jgi:hypothetical protein
VITDVYRLEATAFVGPARWTWRLRGPDGALLAEHDVALDTASWQFHAMSNLGSYLYSLDRPQAALAHHLAAAVLFGLSGSGHLSSSVEAVTLDLTAHPEAAEAFVTPSAVAHAVDQVDGVHLGRLLDALFPDTAARQRALDDILATVRARLA